MLDGIFERGGEKDVAPDGTTRLRTRASGGLLVRVERIDRMRPGGGGDHWGAAQASRDFGSNTVPDVEHAMDGMS